MRSAETEEVSAMSNPRLKATKRTFLQVLDITAGESDPDFMDFGTGDRNTRSIILFFSLSDVTHSACFDGYE